MTSRKLPWVAGLAMVLAGGVYAQDIAGDWQGTLKAGPQELRTILQITKADAGWKATMYSIDQTTDPIPVNTVTLEGSTIQFAVNAVRGSYEGKLSADGSSIDGAWTQGRPLPLRLERATKETAWKIDQGSHTVQFITVDKDVKLEVLDWGGTGRPLVLLTGLGNNAHVFDKFAPRLIGSYHVYGITRRGFGESSKPATGYEADRLGDDVLAVIEALKLNKPVLAGHSIGGEELSSVGSRHPEKVAGLIYLDAGYGYAFYDKARGNYYIDMGDLQRKLDQLHAQPNGDLKIIRELLETSLPAFEKSLQSQEKLLQTLPGAPQNSASGPTPGTSILMGGQKYTNIPTPVLAIYALPHNLGPGATREAQALDEESTAAYVKSFEAGVPTARVVRLAHANHYVFLSNEADVLREMNAFIGSLPQ